MEKLNGVRLKIIPLTLKAANDFVNLHHRHNKGCVGHKFSIGLASESGELIGVAIAGRPVARGLDNGRNIEILRVCVKEGYMGANSKLYSRMKQICQLMGYERVITYTLQTESGAGLRAVGAKIEGKTIGRSWNNKSRARKEQEIYKQDKLRWVL